MPTKTKVNHGAIRTAAATHANTKAHTGKAGKHTNTLKVGKKSPVVVHQYGIVVRNNIRAEKGKTTKATKATSRLVKRPVKYAHSAVVHHTRTATKRRVAPRKAKATTTAAAKVAATAVGAPGVMSSEFAALSLTSPVVATVSPIPDANGAVSMNVLPGSAVPWPPLPEEHLAPEPEPITDEDKKIRIVNDRQKQLQFAQERQERANYLESQINIAAQHGYIIDPAEIQRRRKEITSIGVNDPSTKRAALLIDKDILLKKDKPSHMQRNFNLLVAMVVILVFVALVTGGNDATPEEIAAKAAKAAEDGNDGGTKGPRGKVSVSVGTVAIILVVISGIVTVAEWKSGGSTKEGRERVVKQPGEAKDPTGGGGGFLSGAKNFMSNLTTRKGM